MPARGVSRDARAWCEALADTLLPLDVSAARPVRLNCDDESVAAAGVRLGLDRARALNAFIDCLRREGMVGDEQGVRRLALARAGDPPTYLLGLAVLVLAASRMAPDETGSMAAYYRRLADLLRIQLKPTWPQVRGVPELVDCFDDLADWLERRERGRRGLLDLPTDVHPTVVGVPIHQSLLRAGDRTILGSFFERSGRLIDAGWDPVVQLKQWGGCHQLSTPLQALMDRPSLHAALAGVLRAARQSWDGSTIDASGKRLLPSQLTLHLPPLPFTLSATVPALSQPMAVAGPDGSEISLHRYVPTALPLSWLEWAATGRVVLDLGSESVRILPGPTVVFEITPLGVQSVAAAAEEPVWLLTCEESLIAACQVSQRLAAPLPLGWALLCDVEPTLLVDELRASRGQEDRPLDGVRAIGGLRLAEATWLRPHPPKIVADLPEPALVMVDDVECGEIQTQQALTLDAIADQLGVHRIRIGEQELVVEIVNRGPRQGVGTLGFDVDPRRIHAGPTSLDDVSSTVVVGALAVPATGHVLPQSMIVRYRCPVDVIHVDGSVSRHAPPTPAAWLDHVGLPQDGPWEIPDVHLVAWLCVDAPGRKFVVAYQPVDVVLSDDVLGVVDWYIDVQRVVDRSDGKAKDRWRGLVAAAEDAP